MFHPKYCERTFQRTFFFKFKLEFMFGYTELFAKFDGVDKNKKYPFQQIWNGDAVGI